MNDIIKLKGEVSFQKSSEEKLMEKLLQQRSDTLSAYYNAGIKTGRITVRDARE